MQIANQCLFKVTQILLGKKYSKIYLQGHVEEFAEHLSDKIVHICCNLDARFSIGPWDMTGVQSCLDNWEHFDPVMPEEVDRVLITQPLAH